MQLPLRKITWSARLVRGATDKLLPSPEAVHDGGALGWNGSLETSWLADSAHDLTIIGLSQRLSDGPELPAAHRDTQAAVYASLGVRG